MRVIDLFEQYPYELLTRGNQPELMRSVLLPLLENLEDGLLIYHERKTLLAHLYDSETNERGFGGYAKPLGFLDNSHPQSSWPDQWHFFDSWDDYRLYGSWILSSPYVGFSILIDPDLVQLAKNCLDKKNNEPFDLVHYLLEQEIKQLSEQQGKYAGKSPDKEPQDVMRPGEMMEAYINVLKFVEERVALTLDDTHGVRHWFRVIYYGLKIASKSAEKLDQLVIILFALLHDVDRSNNGFDPEHGSRAAKLIPTLQGKLFNLTPKQLQLLVDACAGHATEINHSDPTVCACWDADRLDLQRLGVKIAPSKLLTSIGKRLALEMQG